MRWSVTVRIPSVMSELSKNRMNRVARIGKRGAIVKSTAYEHAKSRIAEQIRHAITDLKLGMRPEQDPSDWVLIDDAKLWMYIDVEKRQANIDAVNVIDILCDAVQEGCGLNDCWYSIARLDWSINAKDPQVYLTIGQE